MSEGDQDKGIFIGQIAGKLEGLTSEIAGLKIAVSGFKDDLKELPCIETSGKINTLKGVLDGHILLAQHEEEVQDKEDNKIHKKRMLRINILLVFVAILALSNVAEKLLKWIK
ncbi:hypothetical protein LCGC14_0578350 [marine sediment metagenome]|uniref:Uncharacterized protein n=1 Tax=marine sediment metagenome TaxID=412755 RepID=A0A0F9RM91_9ZZZZ